MHQRQPRGSRATDPDDYPAELTAYTMKAPKRIKGSAAALGPAVAEFADRLFHDKLPWSRIRQGHKLIRLSERYRAHRLDAACQRALAVDLIDVQRVERILVQGPGTEGHVPTATTNSSRPLRFARPGSVFAQATGGHS